MRSPAMATHASDPAELAAELARLRRQVRALTVLGFLATAGLVILGLAVHDLARHPAATPLQTALPPGVEVDVGVVLTNGFALRDLDGQVRGFLKLIDGAALVLCDAEGRAQVQFHAIPESRPGLSRHASGCKGKKPNPYSDNGSGAVNCLVVRKKRRVRRPVPTQG